jgi:hypothetical protein
MPIAASVIAVQTTATLLSTGGAGDLHTVVVRNDSGTSIFLGGSGVTAATGMALPTASTFTMDLANGDDLYGITAAVPLNAQVLKTRQ